jgi:hypothetical protein
MSETQGRLVIDVIKQIIPIIPEDKTELMDELQTFKKSLWNKAPELQRNADCWVPFIQLLNKHIPDIVDGWHIEIQYILQNPE